MYIFIIINYVPFSGSMLEKLKETGNVNGVILPGIKEGKWKVSFYKNQIISKIFRIFFNQIKCRMYYFLE